MNHASSAGEGAQHVLVILFSRIFLLNYSLMRRLRLRTVLLPTDKLVQLVCLFCNKVGLFTLNAPSVRGRMARAGMRLSMSAAYYFKFPLFYCVLAWSTVSSEVGSTAVSSYDLGACAVRSTCVRNPVCQCSIGSSGCEPGGEACPFPGSGAPCVDSPTVLTPRPVSMIFAQLFW
jgi:hypothetical protein